LVFQGRGRKEGKTKEQEKAIDCVMVRSSSVFLSIFFSVFLKTFRKGKMASREADDLASVANRAEERLKALESTVFKEREEVKRERVDEKTRERRRRRALSLLAIEHRRPL
jgi:hypothetical protein